jgi:NAD(P)-dependent dehydrogenase (short-subunit alcohol dehydrogenase family)
MTLPSLAGKRVIVTGAASGMGNSTALKLLEAGAEVHSLDRNEPTAPVTAHHTVDLSDPASIDRVVAELGGNWDALLNIAGVPGGKLPDEFVFSVNYLGLRHLTEAIEPHIKKGGSVVNVSSNGDVMWPTRKDVHERLASLTTFAEGLEWYRNERPEGKSYNFSKEATSYYTLTKAIEYTKKGKRINAICPGMTNTPLIEHFTEIMGEKRVEAVQELVGGWVEPEDIANMLVFLITDEAKFVNGQTIDVDGGLKAGMHAGDVPYPGY